MPASFASTSATGENELFEHEQHPVAGPAQAGHGVGRAGDGAVGQPHHAVEIAARRSSGDPPMRVPTSWPCPASSRSPASATTRPKVDLGAVVAPRPTTCCPPTTGPRWPPATRTTSCASTCRSSADGADRYDAAAATLRTWLADGILVADHEPVLTTAYAMTFTDEAGAAAHHRRRARRPGGQPSPRPATTCSPTSRPRPRPRPTGSTSPGPPRPTSRRSGGCRWPRGLAELLDEPGERLGDGHRRRRRASTTLERVDDPAARRGDPRRRGRRRRCSSPTATTATAWPAPTATSGGRRRAAMPGAVRPHAGLRRRAGRGPARRAGHPPPGHRPARRARPRGGARARLRSIGTDAGPVTPPSPDAMREPGRALPGRAGRARAGLLRPRAGAFDGVARPRLGPPRPRPRRRAPPR